MPYHSEESVLLVAHHRFLEEVERAIQAANREIIHKQIPELNKDAFYRLAITVAQMRAYYLEAALRAASFGAAAPASAEAFAGLRAHREKYEEARQAFEALQRAIEQGYVDLREDEAVPAARRAAS
ncbi:MAG: hypothetical protein HY246_15680 [Proteobacteria bacterium]|nr:hypothetical protein [Pseudomonadota bacterium]